MPGLADLYAMATRGAAISNPSREREQIDAGELGTVSLPVTKAAPTPEPKRRRPRRRRRTPQDRLLKLLTKAQMGAATAPAGEAVAWAAVPEQARQRLEPAMGGTVAGWSLAELDGEDLMTLRQMMGKDGWQQWLRTQRAALDNPNWSPPTNPAP